MNLDKLFKTQKILDDKIVKEKGLEGQDLLDKKILALQVELGELANEWRGFKFWSENQEPNTDTFRMVKCNHCKGNIKLVESCEVCWGRGAYSVGRKNPLLEEYVDCLHFILSIGNDIGITMEEIEGVTIRSLSITKTFIDIYIGAGVLMYEYQPVKSNYCKLLKQLIDLGEMLGFTWEQIEQAYYDKNKVNHERQNNGY